MRLPTSNLELRKALDLKGLDAIDHKRAIASLAQRYSHSITFDGLHAEETCVPYALSLTDDEAYEAVRRTYRRIYAGPRFFHWLMDNDHLQAVTTPTKDCFACYFVSKEFKHVGIVLGKDSVMSKWGEMPRYQHPIAEVPLEYGMCVRFFNNPGPNTARRLFREFALTMLAEEEIERATAKYRACR